MRPAGRASIVVGALAALALLPCACASRPAQTVTVSVPASGTTAQAVAEPTTPVVPEDPGPPSPEAADGPANDPAPTNERGWLGVELEPAAPDESGVRIARIVPKSPAALGGLLAGDLLERLDGEPVAAPQDVVSAISGRSAGARVGLLLKRQSADRLVAVTLGALPERDEIYRMGFVDQPAPPFEALATAKGTFVPTLLAQRGHVVIVEFWAPYCVACRALIPHMNQWHAAYAARGVRVVGITNEPVPRAAAAAGELGMEYPVASDESGKTIALYDAHAIPAVFVIDRAGTVRDVMVGYDAVRLPQLDELVQRLVAER